MIIGYVVVLNHLDPDELNKRIMVSDTDFDPCKVFLSLCVSVVLLDLKGYFAYVHFTTHSQLGLHFFAEMLGCSVTYRLQIFVSPVFQEQLDGGGFLAGAGPGYLREPEDGGQTPWARQLPALQADRGPPAGLLRQ